MVVLTFGPEYYRHPVGGAVVMVWAEGQAAQMWKCRICLFLEAATVPNILVPRTAHGLECM
jgi:hypothetical protein